MKKLNLRAATFAAASLLLAFAATAQTTATSNQNQQSSSVSQSSSAGGTGGSGIGMGGAGGSASASNAGNNQQFNPVLNFNSPDVSTSNVNQTVSGTTTQNVNTTGTQRVDSNSVSTVNGTQTVNNVSSGGTNSTQRVINEGATTQNVNYSGTQTIKNVPSMNAPPLTTSNDTCMGSTSGSVAAPGVGISIGSTWTDDNCLRLKNSRELWNMGVRAAALELLCTDANNRRAIELSWKSDQDFLCAVTVAERAQKQAQASQMRVSQTVSVPPAMASAANDPQWANANLNDPYVARRAANAR